MTGDSGNVGGSRSLLWVTRKAFSASDVEPGYDDVPTTMLQHTRYIDWYDDFLISIILASQAWLLSPRLIARPARTVKIENT